MNAWPERLCARLITGFARALTGARAIWHCPAVSDRPRVYFANHASHGDFVLVWAAIPPPLRRRVRPVAGADYWLRGRLRRYIGCRVFRALLVDRNGAAGRGDPVADMAAAIAAGDSLILFPEGTRNTGEERLLPFKSGIYHLARLSPAAEFVPVWIDNLNRVLPKGRILPVPLLCTVSFGTALTLAQGEDKAVFLERARAALLALAPEPD